MRLMRSCTAQAAREDLITRERSHEAAVDYLRRECDDLRHELAQQQAQVTASIFRSFATWSARLCIRLRHI